MEGMAYVSENFWHDAVNKATTDLFTFGYKNIIKPNFVFNHTPDVAHDQMIQVCNVTKRIPPLMWLLREMLDYTDPVLETTVMGVDFANPFGLSAGLDKNCDMPVLMDNVGFGFETVGSTTSRASAGNPKPWFHRLPEYAFDDGARGPCQRRVRQGDRPRGAGVDEREDDAGVRLHRTHQRRQVRRPGRRHRGLLHLHAPRGRTQRHGRGQRVMSEHPMPASRSPPTRTRSTACSPSSTRSNARSRRWVKMPLNKTWPEFKDLLDALAEHNVQGLSIANLQKDRTGLEIPQQWEGGLSGGPVHGGQRGSASRRSTVNTASVSPSPADRPACSPRSRHIARFATAPAWSCSSAH